MVGGLQSKNASSGNMMCSRIIYGTLLAVAAVVALLMKYFANNVVLDLPMFKFGCVDNTIEVSSLEESITVVCGGNQAVYRICFGAGVFFLIMMIGAPISPSFHNGCWVAKIVLFPLLIAACFFIPNEFFHGYYVTAVVFAAIFLVLQVLLLIDFSYRIHECIIKRMDQVDDNNESAEEGKGSCNMWKPIYLGFCVICILGCIGVIVAMYILFPCPLGYGMTSLTLFIAIITIILSLVEKFHCGLLPGANVAIYMAFESWGAMSSHPEPTCNPHFATLDLHDVWGVVFAFVVTFVTVAWMSVSMGGGIGRLCNQPDDFSKFEDKDDDDEDSQDLQEVQNQLDKRLAGEDLEMAQLEPDQSNYDSDQKKKKKKKNKKSTKEVIGETEPEAPTACQERVALFLFHLALFCATFYTAMICTFWINALDVSEMQVYTLTLSNGTATTSTVITGSWYALGAKFGAAGASFAVFLWSLFTALCCDVGQDNDDDDDE